MTITKQLEQARAALETNNAWEDLISQEDAAKKLGITINTLTKMRYSGKIKKWYNLNGRNIMLSKLELLTLLKSQ